MATAGEMWDLLPDGGSTRWVIGGAREIVGFALVDRAALRVETEHGLVPQSAGELPMPFIVEHLEQNPDDADLVCTVVEVTSQSVFELDGRSPALDGDVAVGLWLASASAPDAHPAAQLASRAGAEGLVYGLGLWLDDQDFVDHMRASGHQADHGSVSFTEDTDRISGSILLNDLELSVVATPTDSSFAEEGIGTQVMLPTRRDAHPLVLAGRDPHHTVCDASWWATGTHPLAASRFIGPAFLTTYDTPLVGSAYGAW